MQVRVYDRDTKLILEEVQNLQGLLPRVLEERTYPDRAGNNRRGTVVEVDVHVSGQVRVAVRFDAA
jgi:hypothetical protein